MQKAIGELLVSDYSRKGFIDGRVLRLPTIVVRPGKPNKAASTFFSSIIREPLKANLLSAQFKQIRQYLLPHHVVVLNQ